MKWPEPPTSRVGARRAPRPPTKSEPPQLAAESRPRPAAVPEGFIRLWGRHLGRWVVSLLGGHVQAGAVAAHVDLAVLAVHHVLMAGIDKRVLVARLLGDVEIAFLDTV